MITVRFPSGFSVQYNNLCAQKWNKSGHLLYGTHEDRDAGRNPRVSVPPEALIEFVSPCRIYQAAALDTDRIAALEKEIRGLRRQIKGLVKR